MSRVSDTKDDGGIEKISNKTISETQLIRTHNDVVVDDDDEEQEETEALIIDDPEVTCFPFYLVTFRTSTNEIIKNKMNRDCASQCLVVRTILEVNADDDYCSTAVENFGVNIRAEILDYVVKFLKFHDKHPMSKIIKPMKSHHMKDLVTDEWYINFIDTLSPDLWIEIIEAASYLVIPSLLDLMCTKLATTLLIECRENGGLTALTDITISGLL